VNSTAQNSLRLFVTGTDTDVGKTIVAATLVRALGADYWKPIQTGSDDETGDTATVRRLTGLEAERAHPPAFVFAAPVSPHDAAAREGASIDMGRIVPPPTTRPLVAEGAGGALVPLAPAPGSPGSPIYMADLAAQLDFPTIIVARNRLGTINHTLLTIEAFRARSVPILGVILNAGDMTTNSTAIEQFGQTKILYEMPHLTTLDPIAIENIALDLQQKLGALV
jgi:malonyl-CoA O-methyltransferase